MFQQQRFKVTLKSVMNININAGMRGSVMMMFVTITMAMILAIIVMFYASGKRKCYN